MVNHPIKQDVEALKADQRLWRAVNLSVWTQYRNIGSARKDTDCGPQRLGYDENMILSVRLLSSLCALALLATAAPKTGRQLFETNCSMCHGRDGTGGHGGANLRGDLKYGHDVKSISNVITRGIPSNGMPSFASHSPAEIHKLAEYVLTLHRQGQARAERGSIK